MTYVYTSYGTLALKELPKVESLSRVDEGNQDPAEGPSVRLREYLTAFTRRHVSEVADCFVRSALLELPMVKPSRFVGLQEIEEAHRLAFENLSHVQVQHCEVLSDAACAMTVGELVVVCRGKTKVHPFALCSDGTSGGLSRVSWYLNSRGHRHWSDQAVL
jgi:hypothetical protein